MKPKVLYLIPFFAVLLGAISALWPSFFAKPATLVTVELQTTDGTNFELMPTIVNGAFNQAYTLEVFDSKNLNLGTFSQEHWRSRPTGLVLFPNTAYYATLALANGSTWTCIRLATSIAISSDGQDVTPLRFECHQTPGS